MRAYDAQRGSKRYSIRDADSLFAETNGATEKIAQINHKSPPIKELVGLIGKNALDAVNLHKCSSSIEQKFTRLGKVK